MCEEADRANGIYEVRRTAEITSQYAAAVREVSKEQNVAVLDLWTIFMKRVGWRVGDPLIGSRASEQDLKSGLPALLEDGLHLTAQGSRVLYEELIQLIQRTWPDQTPEALPFVVPSWADEEAWKDL
jgi:lysophospholipase L1-like esterase